MSRRKPFAGGGFLIAEVASGDVFAPELVTVALVRQDALRHVLQTTEGKRDSGLPAEPLDLDFRLEGLEEFCVPHVLL